MPFVQRLSVSPRLPTALAGHANIDLPGHDLWLYYVLDNVHTIPTILDVPRFEEALSKALQLYPHTAGQLRSSDGRWFVELTDTAVSVDIEYKLHTTSDTLLNGDWVNQDDISVFLNPVSPYPVNDGGPLLRFKLTFLDNETCIGVSWHHVLGDAMLMQRFMHTLSQFYQGLPQEYAPPTFQKHHFPKPSSAMSAEFLPCLSHLHITRHPSEFFEEYVEFRRNFQDLRWRVEDRDITELRSILSSRGQNECYLSRQDCLSAYVVAVLNHNRSTPVQTIATVSSYRSVCAPFIAEGMAGNQVQCYSAAVPTNLAGIATAVRHALVQCRKPDHLHGVMSVASDLMLEAANTAKVIALTHRDDTIVAVDSFAVVDWCGAHFGYPDGSRFYTSGIGKQFLRCWRSNPVKGDDGVWRARQSFDISMGVLGELKPRLVDTLARGVRYILDNEHTRL